MKLTDNQRRVVEILGNEAMTAPRLAYVLDRKDSSCRSLVDRLKKRELVRSIGRNSVLVLTEAGRAILSDLHAERAKP